MNERIIKRRCRIEIVALLALLAGCGGSGPLRPDGGQAGSGGSPGTGGAAGTGGSTGSGGTSGTGGTNGSGGVPGTGGVAGSGGAAGSGGTPGSGGAGGVAGSDGGVTCNCGNFSGERSCCGDRCLNLRNDPLNCGACGNKCPTDKPLCESSVCRAPLCGGALCGAGGSCCDGICCQPNQICCQIRGPVDFIRCYTPTAEQPSCPLGCYPQCMSDRNIKRAIAPVDPQEVLTKVSQLPISTWQYLSDPESVRHMGPMAQDFRQAFGLGDSDRAYHPIDGHGVALASIQALAKLAADQQRRLELLQRHNDVLKRRLNALEGKQRARVVFDQKNPRETPVKDVAQLNGRSP